MYSVQMKDLAIQVDPNSTVPAYRQIVDQLRHYLVEGELVPDDQLPGVRRLAMDLGVHFNTVAEAYRTLAQEGWVEVSQGKSVRVLRRSESPVQSKKVEMAFRQKLRMLIAEMRGSGLSVETVDRELRHAAEGMKS